MPSSWTEGHQFQFLVSRFHFWRSCSSLEFFPSCSTASARLRHLIHQSHCKYMSSSEGQWQMRKNLSGKTEAVSRSFPRKKTINLVWLAGEAACLRHLTWFLWDFTGKKISFKKIVILHNLMSGKMDKCVQTWFYMHVFDKNPAQMQAGRMCIFFKKKPTCTTVWNTNDWKHLFSLQEWKLKYHSTSTNMQNTDAKRKI